MRAMKALGTRDRSKYNCLLTNIKDTKRRFYFICFAVYVLHTKPQLAIRSPLERSQNFLAHQVLKKYKNVANYRKIFCLKIYIKCFKYFHCKNI